jgi:putative glutamine amidotransferase
VALRDRRPLVGLSTRRWSGRRFASAVSPAYAEADFDLNPTDYPAAVAAAGGLPVNLCRDVEAAEVVERINGLVITGGADVDPSAYGGTSSGVVEPTEPERDRWELALIAAAVDQGVPLLGICRGMQLLNVYAGGTLIADLPRDQGDGHPRFDGHRGDRAHPVTFDQGTTAARIYGPRLEVNSLHHQAVDRLGMGLVVSGRSPDGVVEAIELPGQAVLGVQWHPEALGGPDPALSWLVQAVAQHAERVPVQPL